MRRLQQDGVAEDEVRAREPSHLVVGEVPRHDPEQRTNRGTPDQGGAVAVHQLDRLVLEKVLRVVGVVAVDVG
jgi:hypothetical protein